VTHPLYEVLRAGVVGWETAARYDYGYIQEPVDHLEKTGRQYHIEYSASHPMCCKEKTLWSFRHSRHSSSSTACRGGHCTLYHRTAWPTWTVLRHRIGTAPVERRGCFGCSDSMTAKIAWQLSVNNNHRCACNGQRYLKVFSTRLPSNLKPTTRECVHLVMRGHFRSRDEDGGHTIRFTIAINPMLHANFLALCFIEPELLPTEVLHCGNRDFRPFIAPVTLTFTRWPSHTNLTRIASRYTECAKVNFLSQGLWKLSYYYRHTLQTDRRHVTYIPRRFTGGQNIRPMFE